jgi:hypothetical protein
MSFDGTWKCVMNTPMGKQEVQLTLASAGKRLSGTLSGPMGDAPVQDGQVDGDSATWKCPVTKPMALTLEFNAKASGDTLAGDIKLGMFGKAAFSGTRA